MDRKPFALFAGEIVHELRTPLSVIFGDLDLALASDRTPVAYRATLTRIAERVAALLDMTADFAMFGDISEGVGVSSGWASLGAVFAALSERYGPRRGSPVTLGAADYDVDVTGDEILLAGALSLLIEHALRHRREATPVRLYAFPPEGDAGRREIDLVLDAGPGFADSTWRGLAAPSGSDRPAGGPLLVAMAVDVIDECGGSVELAPAGGADAVRIRLRVADPPADTGDGIE